MRQSIALILLLAFLAPCGRASEKPKWLRVTSANFVVYSDAGEKRARAIAERLEGFRALLATLFPKVIAAAQSEPLVVIAFHDDGAFKPFKPLFNGKPANLAGVYLSSSDRSMVALDASANEGSYRVVFHEYIHKVVHGAADVPVPTWFSEGIAEFYSTATTKGLTAQIGYPIVEHVAYLQDRGVLPLDQLFAVTHDSPDYNERIKQGRFYAQSWAFVHSMMLSDQGAHRNQLSDFVARLTKGEAPAKAFQSAFGMDLRAGEAALKSYLRQTTMPLFNLPFKSTTPVETARVEPAPDVEVEFHLGTALALQQRQADAEPRFRRAMEIDPASSLPYEGLGMLALQKKDRASAKAAFTEAIKRDSKSYYAQYYYASSLIETGDPKSMEAARAVLERVVELRPSFGGAYSALSHLLLRSNDTDGAETWANRGLKVDPGDVRCRYALAAAQLQARKFDEARATLKQIIDTGNDESIRRAAQGMLKSADEYEAMVKAGATPARADVPVPSTAPPTENVEEEPEPAHDPARVQSYDDLPSYLRLGAAGLRGQLLRVECDGTKITVRVKVDGRALTFSHPDSGAIALFAVDLQSSDPLDCGVAMDRDVIVQFDPTELDSKSGTLKAIVFMKKAPN
jgi:cytochrome c-type biogenesis protein CcmH/NrfG